ncbi:MAG: hypothetical protein OXI54_04505 [Chloroflexota bacterium]|nr:hypothetical protein [Chloroflexota bacterium]
MVRPENFADHFDWAKLAFLSGLTSDDWAYHPMYFARSPDRSFPCRYASFLGVHLVDGDIWDRNEVVGTTKNCPDHILLDPDKGIGGRNSERITIGELAKITGASPVRADKLILIYNQSIDRWYDQRGDPDVQIRYKLAQLYCDYEVHGNAYVSSLLSFVWVSKNQNTVTNATRRLLDRSGLPSWRLVSDGCCHIPS